MLYKFKKLRVADPISFEKDNKRQTDFVFQLIVEASIASVA
jgi:hypothetical protein